jgi:hypothetical protein
MPNKPSVVEAKPPVKQPAPVGQPVPLLPTQQQQVSGGDTRPLPKGGW